MKAVVLWGALGLLMLSPSTAVAEQPPFFGFALGMSRVAAQQHCSELSRVWMRVPRSMMTKSQAQFAGKGDAFACNAAGASTDGSPGMMLLAFSTSGATTIAGQWQGDGVYQLLMLLFSRYCELTLIRAKPEIVACNDLAWRLTIASDPSNSAMVLLARPDYWESKPDQRHDKTPQTR